MSSETNTTQENQTDAGDTRDDRIRNANRETRTERTGRRRRTSSGAGVGAAALLLLAGIWVVVGAFFWGDPVGAEDVVARADGADGAVVVEAAAINGASTLYWSNIVVGVIIVVLAIVALAVAGGYLSDQ